MKYLINNIINKYKHLFISKFKYLKFNRFFVELYKNKFIININRYIYIIKKVFKDIIKCKIVFFNNNNFYGKWIKINKMYHGKSVRMLINSDFKKRYIENVKFLIWGRYPTKVNSMYNVISIGLCKENSHFNIPCITKYSGVDFILRQFYFYTRNYKIIKYKKDKKVSYFSKSFGKNTLLIKIISDSKKIFKKKYFIFKINFIYNYLLNNNYIDVFNILKKLSIFYNFFIKIIGFKIIKEKLYKLIVDLNNFGVPFIIYYNNYNPDMENKISLLIKFIFFDNTESNKSISLSKLRLFYSKLKLIDNYTKENIRKILLLK